MKVLLTVCCLIALVTQASGKEPLQVVDPYDWNEGKFPREDRAENQRQALLTRYSGKEVQLTGKLADVKADGDGLYFIFLTADYYLPAVGETAPVLANMMYQVKFADKIGPQLQALGRQRAGGTKVMLTVTGTFKIDKVKLSDGKEVEKLSTILEQSKIVKVTIVPRMAATKPKR